MRLKLVCRVMCGAVALTLGACSHAGSAATAAGTEPSAGGGTAPQATPRVNQNARAIASMQERIKEYVELHNKLESTLPKLPKEADPKQIDANQRALAKLVQQARKNAKPGDIFTADARAAIRQLMNQVFGGADGRQLRDSIMDENPGNLKLTVNSRYPDTVPLSTVPPQVLAGLPPLPEDVEYRFIGRHLILLDVHAHIIADLIENAIPA